MMHKKSVKGERELYELFIRDEGLQTASGMLSDLFSCQVSIVVEKEGRNRIYFSTELNLDRLETLNRCVSAIKIREEGVYSYDGMYNCHAAYPLRTSQIEGALLLDSEKKIHAPSAKLLSLFSLILRHEMLKDKWMEAQITDLTTGIKNRYGLYQTFEERKDAFCYLSCIRIKNRAEILSAIGGKKDSALSIKCLNAIFRIDHHQVYKIEQDSFVVLFESKDAEEIREILFQIKDSIVEAIPAAEVCIYYTACKKDPYEALFFAESGVRNATRGEIAFLGVAEEDFSILRKKSVEEEAVEEDGKYYPESELYSVKKANVKSFREEEVEILSEYEEVKEEETDIADLFDSVLKGNEEE